MGRKLLTELLGLSKYIVKNILINKMEILLTPERVGFPICPYCGQHYIKAAKWCEANRIDQHEFGADQNG